MESTDRRETSQASLARTMIDVAVQRDVDGVAKASHGVRVPHLSHGLIWSAAGARLSHVLDDIEQRVVDDIVEHGWHLLWIHADDETPAFVYSVGLMVTLAHPEIIMFGLAPKLMGNVINDAGRQIRHGRNFAELGLFEGLLEGYACKFVPVRRAWHERYLGYAMWHRRHVGKIGTLEAVQCLWPDKAGVFPDEEGCATAVVDRQPLLHRHPEAS